MIPSDVVEDILQRISIVDLISQFVVLKKSGQNYKGLCPFHSDKNNPSLSVSEDKGLYHCFSCGVGGNALTFVKEYHSLDFIESVKSLAEFVGIDLSQYLENKSSLPLQNKIKEMHLLAQNYFVSQLFDKKNKNALLAVSILKTRKFDKKSIHHFGLGFGGSSNRGLFDILSEKFAKNEILESGLCGEDSKKKIYDRFKNRITFPISNNVGNPIAFGGRALSENSPSKYINSPETILFKKKYHLYGWHLAKETVSETGKILIVEGYIDVIRLFQAGFPFAVAPLGTGLTEHHMLFLKNKIDTAYFCLDGDASGQKSAYRCAGIASKNNIENRIIKIPADHDPDSFLLEYGSNAFSDLIDQSMPSETFILNRAESCLPNLHLFMETIFEYAVNIEGDDTSISLNMLTQSFLKKACFLANVSYLSIEQDFLRYKESQKRQNSSNNKESIQPLESDEAYALEFLSAISLFPKHLGDICEIISPDEMPSLETKTIFAQILANSDASVLSSKFFENPDMVKKMSCWIQEPDLRTLKNYALSLKVKNLKKKRNSILEETKKISPTTDLAIKNLDELVSLQSKISDLKQKLYYL